MSAAPPVPGRSPQPAIGLVGGIGAGKSLVARQFAQLGCAVINADDLARQVLAEPEVVAELERWWGPGVRGAEGKLDRQAVSRIVFADARELRRLEELVHPRVHALRRGLREQYAADSHVLAVVEDCPLLVEKGIDRCCDVVVLVDAPREQRLQRVQRDRGWSAAELGRREKNQAGLDTKARRADYVVENSAGEAECFAHVRRVLTQILQKFRDTVQGQGLR